MSKQADAQVQVTKNPEDDHPHYLKSKATIASPTSHSLRSTIPEGIVAFLDLKESDKLCWTMDINEKEERIAIVKKLV
jgi:hypothetical protein